MPSQDRHQTDPLSLSLANSEYWAIFFLFRRNEFFNKVLEIVNKIIITINSRCEILTLRTGKALNLLIHFPQPKRIAPLNTASLGISGTTMVLLGNLSAIYSCRTKHSEYSSTSIMVETSMKEPLLSRVER